MEAEKIERINALAHKAKSVGLTEEEKKERELLRKEYIAYVRLNLRTQLDNIDIKEADGSVVNLGEKYGHKKGNEEKSFCSQKTVYRCLGGGNEQSDHSESGGSSCL